MVREIFQFAMGLILLILGVAIIIIAQKLKRR